MRDRAPRTIGLLDHMGYGNLGDAAIQESVIANIKKRVPDVAFVGFSLMPADTMKRHGIPSHPIRWWYPQCGRRGDDAARTMSLPVRLRSALKRWPLVHAWAKPLVDVLREALFWVHSYRVLRRLDVLIISGGGQLGELWHGPWSHPYTVFKFCLLAKLARKDLYLLNVGAGPLEHPLSRFFARWAVRFSDYRSFRDQDSQDLVRRLGVKAETHVYPDPVYALEIGDQMRSAPCGSSKPIVGLNPIGFCDPRLWPRKDAPVYREYLEKLTRFSAWLLEQGYDLRVFTTETSVDWYAIEDLRARLHARVSSPERVSQVFTDASESVKGVLRQMSEFDFVVTSKFHGIIFSHLLGKPVIALSYHRKMDVAMRAAGQGHFCADAEGFDVEWLIKSFRLLVTESARIRSESTAAVQANAARLSEQFDGLFLPQWSKSSRATSASAALRSAL
jgi:polysaccharide pyruvyl transferase WcaK-like protein